MTTHAQRRHGSSRALNTPAGTKISRTIDALMDRQDSRVLLCVRAHDHDAIRGWIVFAEGIGVPVVHYCYVRKEDRDQGVITSLLAHIGVRHDAGVICTSHGPSSTMLRGRYKASVHVPVDEFLHPPR